jgi:hypothetical protein
MSFIANLFSKAGKDTVSSAFNGVSSILDEVITTKEERAKVDIEFNKLQTEINKLESQNASVFVSGWRPFVGWVCATGLGFNYVIRPIMNYVILLLNNGIPTMQTMSMSEMLTLLTGMLGFGALRSYEKRKNKARD